MLTEDTKLNHSKIVSLLVLFTLYSLQSKMIIYISLGYFLYQSFFIHSGDFYSAPSSPLLLRGAPDYSTDRLLYRSFTPKRTGNSTAGKGLAQCSYAAARAGVEPTTLRLKVIVSTKEPPRPTIMSISEDSRQDNSRDTIYPIR